MSHHLDSPLASADLRLDITDLYVFAGQSGTVFVMNVCTSLAGDIPTPGFHPEALYEFKIDIDDDAVEDLTLRFHFDDRDSAGLQRYTLTRLNGVDAADPHAPGTTVATGVTETALTTDAGVRVWIGVAGDPFWMEPEVLHAVAHALQDGTVVALTDWDAATASNQFAGHTVYSIVLDASAPPAPPAPPRRVGPARAGPGRRRMAHHQSGGPADDPPAVHPIQRRPGRSPQRRITGHRRRHLRRLRHIRSRRGSHGDRHRKRSHCVRPSCRRPPTPQRAALHRGDTRRVWVRIVERSQPDRQRTRCDVHPRHQHAAESVHRQRVGIPTTVDGVSLRPTATAWGMTAEAGIPAPAGAVSKRNAKTRLWRPPRLSGTPDGRRPRPKPPHCQERQEP